MKKQEQGVVYIEMIVVLFPVLLVFMGITQLGLAYVARLVVRHAANVAVRAAVVVLEDDPERYGGTTRGSLEPASTASASRDSRRDPFSSVPERTPADGDLLSRLSRLRQRAGDPSRRGEIRWAAMFPLLAIAPDPRGLSTDFQRASIREVLGDAGTRSTGGLLYNLGATAVSFPEHLGATSHRTRRYAPREEVVVRVTHLFHCAVPFVARLLCHLGRDLRSGHLLPSRVHASPKSSPSQSAARELDQVALPSIRDFLLSSGGRFLLLQAEAALPNQGASYERHP